jgi:hypothetical protein
LLQGGAIGTAAAALATLTGSPGSVTVTARHATLGSASAVIAVTTARSVSYV